MHKRILLLISSIFVFLSASQAQYTQKRGIEYSGFFDSYYWRGPLSFSLGGAAVLYSGDVCESLACNDISPSYSLGVGYKVWPHVYFGGDFNIWNIGGTSPDSKLSGYSFKTSAKSLSLFGRYYFREDIIHKTYQIRKKPKVFKPYALLGIGAGQFNPVVSYQDSTSSGSLSSSNFEFYIPIGLGASLDFSHRLSVLIEAVLNYGFSDKIDGLDASVLPASENNDLFGVVNLKIQYSPWAKRLRKKRIKMHPPTGEPSMEGTGGGSGSSTPSDNSGGGSSFDNQENNYYDTPADDATTEDENVETEEAPAEDNMYDDGGEETEEAEEKYDDEGYLIEEEEEETDTNTDENWD